MSTSLHCNLRKFGLIPLLGTPDSCGRWGIPSRQFLERFATTIGEDEHAVMILDRASWHDSRALSVPANVTLVALPPYSPELNPVERIWLYLKERFLSHRLHDDYDAIVDAACRAWNRRGRPHKIALHLPVDPTGRDLRFTVLLKPFHCRDRDALAPSENCLM